MYFEITVHGANRLNYQADFTGKEFDNLVISEDDLADAVERFANGLAGVDKRSSSERTERAQSRNRLVDEREQQAADETPGVRENVGERFVDESDRKEMRKEATKEEDKPFTGKEGSRRAQTDFPKTEATVADAKKSERTRT